MTAFAAAEAGQCDQCAERYPEQRREDRRRKAHEQRQPDDRVESRVAAQDKLKRRGVFGHFPSFRERGHGFPYPANLV